MMRMTTLEMQTNLFLLMSVCDFQPSFSYVLCI
jgi:hypothetical protein